MAIVVDWDVKHKPNKQIYGKYDSQCFQGAATAAEMIPTMDEFKKAQTIKINPDKPQEQARYLTIDVSSRETANIF